MTEATVQTELDSDAHPHRDTAYDLTDTESILFVTPVPTGPHPASFPSLYKPAKSHSHLPLSLLLSSSSSFFAAYYSMGLVVDSFSSSDLLLSDVLYKTAFVITVLRWAFYWALRLRRRLQGSDLLDSELEYEVLQSSSSSCTTSPSSSSQLIRDSLIQTTFEEVTRRQGNSCRFDTCAVCLNQLEMADEVRELRNCCHVFHTDCIDRWLDYNGHDHHHDHGSGGQEDNHKTCPLCRTPLLTSSQMESLSWEQQRSQPSWAVERLLYLFGEDLVL